MEYGRTSVGASENLASFASEEWTNELTGGFHRFYARLSIEKIFNLLIFLKVADKKPKLCVETFMQPVGLTETQHIFLANTYKMLEIWSTNLEFA